MEESNTRTYLFFTSLVRVCLPKTDKKYAAKIENVVYYPEKWNPLLNTFVCVVCLQKDVRCVHNEILILFIFFLCLHTFIIQPSLPLYKRVAID